jgi:hypothetical protein
MRESEAKGFRKQQLDDAMRRLFEANKIHVEEYGKPSRRSYRLRLGRKGLSNEG